MRETTLQPPANLTPSTGGVVVRFAGDSGDGIQLSGMRLTMAAALGGKGVSTLPDFPAEIRAPAGTTYGVSAFQLRVGEGEVLTPGDTPDVLVAFNPASLKTNLSDLDRNGLLVVDSGTFTARSLKKAGYDDNPLEADTLNGVRTLAPDISRHTIDAVKEFELGQKGSLRCRNMWAVGLTLWLLDRDTSEAEHWIRNRFGDTPVGNANLAALKAGHAYGETTEVPGLDLLQTRETPHDWAPGEYRTITGAEALAFGLAAAAERTGLDIVFCAYPITPASTLLHQLSAMRRRNVLTFQAEDEIGAACAAIGASYGGALGVTSSSGPGISLKAEALGLAVAVELPLVVVNSQRAGPSTGMPTKTEQADLLQALYGRHGEAPLVVLAPRSPSDCYTSRPPASPSGT
ncbi:MAG: 2-oxoacid:acceptor oxidoreductase family protein [Rhodospirillales bacterium]|nr:2-oxoacid:acceptor oxidoreductase family protein [Rhodospirillales bacterium]